MSGITARRLRRAAATLGVLLLLIAAACAWIVGTESGTRFAVSRFLSFYNDRVQGAIRVERVSGSLLGGLELQDVVLADRGDNPIIESKRVVLDLVPRSLMEGVLHASNIRVEDTKLFIRFYGDESAFVDLGPKGDGAPEPKEPFDELVLPLSLAADHVRVMNTRLFSVNGDTPEEIVSAEDVMLYGAWSGGNARFRIQEVKARLPHDSIVLSHFSGTAVMEGGTRTRLENASAKTNRGDISFGEARFDIDTVDAVFHLRFETNSERFADLARLQDGLRADGSVALTLDEGEDLAAEVSLFSGSTSVVVSAESLFSELPDTAGRISVRRFAPEELGIPLDATLGGDGEFRFSMKPTGKPAFTATFEGKDCNLLPIGPLSISARGDLADGTVDASVRLSGLSSLFVAEGTMAPDGKSAFDWRVDASNLRSLGKAASLKRTGGKLAGEGQCVFENRVLSCAYSLLGSRLKFQDVQAASLRSNGEMAIGEDLLSVAGATRLKNLRLPGLVFNKLSLDTKKRPRGFAVALDGRERGGHKVSMSGDVTLGKKEVQVALDQLKSDIGGIAFELAAPARIVLTENSASLDPKGVQIEAAGGTVSLFGAVDKNCFRKVRVELANVDLKEPARLVGKKGVEGRADLTLSADGPFPNPRLSLSGTVTDFAALHMSRKTLRLEASLEDRDFGFNVAVKERGAVRLRAGGQTGLSLNLKTMKASLMKERPGEVDFEVRKVSDHDLAPFVALPEGLTFTADASGRCVFSSIEDMSLKGRIEGEVSHPIAGRMKPGATFEIYPNRQTVSLEVSSEKSPVFHGDVRATVSLPKLFRGELYAGRSDADFSIGGSSLSLQVDALEEQRMKIRTQFAGVDTTLLGNYMEGLPISGTVSGQAIFERSEDSVSLTAEMSARNFTVNEVKLGTWKAAVDWQDGLASFQARLRQKNRAVASVDAKLPLTMDPRTWAVTWHPNRQHEISWQIAEPDIASIVPMLYLKDARVSRVVGSGRFSGTTANVSGKADLRVVLTHSTLGDLPIEATLQTEAGVQKLAVDFLTGRSGAFFLRAESKLNLEALRQGKVRFERLPLKVSLEMPGFDLANLNVLDLSPVYDLSGTVSCSMKLTGSWASPRMIGRASLKGGALSLADLVDPIRDINAALQFTDKSVRLKRFEAKSRKGSVAAAANGVFTKQGNLTLRAVFKARSFRIAYAGLPVFLLSTDTNLNLGVRSSLVKLDFTLRNSVIEHITADNLKVKRVPVNENTRVTDRGEEAETKPVKKGPGRDIRLTVKTSNPLEIQGAALDTKWQVDIDTLFHRGGVQIDGDAVLKKGSFDLFANTFIVDEAGAFFTEQSGLDPHIQLSSSTTLPDAKVYLKMEGTVGSPRLKLYSDPALPQEAILSMLISGSSEENVSGSSVIANVIQMRYPVVTNILQSKLGFDRVAIGSAPSGSGTVVKLGKRLSDKLFFYTSFNLNAEADENDYEVNFEYDIVDRVTLDTLAGNAVSSVDIGWRVPLRRKSRDMKKQKKEN